jgi:hypothetical protein
MAFSEALQQLSAGEHNPDLQRVSHQ